MKRILIIGFPRSGTTLLQTLLGAHPDIAVFPESHVLSLALQRPFGLPMLARRRQPSLPLVRRFLENCDQSLPPDAEHEAAFAAWDASWLPRPKNLAAATVALLDQLAHLSGKTAWLEKTPDHLIWWRAFAAAAPDTSFVHIQREPEAAVASFFRAAQSWPGASTDLTTISRKWNAAMKRSLACIGRPNHFFVGYEALVETPHEIAESLSNRLGMAPAPGFSHAYEQVAQRVILRSETHKARNVGGIARAQSGFDKLTAPQQQAISDVVDRSLYEAFARVQTIVDQT